MQGYLRIPKQAAAYSAVSPRTFETWLRRGLKYVKIGAVRLTKPSWIDEFLAGYVVDDNQVDRIVDEVMESIRKEK